MSICRRKIFLLTNLSLIAFLLLALGARASSSENPNLGRSSVVLERSPVVLSPEARQFLAKRDSHTATVWVFFTDKGVRSESAFRTAATSVTLSDRTRTRRAKVDRELPVFADLPVVTNYIAGVAAGGAKVRRVSRWLNAVSVDIPMERLEALAALPYVQRISPVARYKKVFEAEATERPDLSDVPIAQASPIDLNYGGALAQLTQIKVPQVHARGINGQGVTLAIFDTGFRKTHEAFANAFAEGRVLAEWDFIFEDGNTSNEGADVSSQWNHGTGCWGVAGGLKDGSIYGPAYEANFILCKTEDVRSETPAEEDNWVAALEWVDSIGADVITSSLSYPDFYTFSQLDGNTATITLAANTAAGLGIVVCNAMGNSGSAFRTLGPPADAYDILSCGSVQSDGNISSFSSRGPTADGRLKPEVCARGTATTWVSASSNTAYGQANGTSLSTPLVAGVACLVIQANPTWSPTLVIQAMKETASRASNPDSTYGWGIIDAEKAVSWGAGFTASVTTGNAPLAVQFTDISTIPATSKWWYFGDGDSSSVDAPVHVYGSGLYTVRLVRQTSLGPLTGEQSAFIRVLADTIKFGVDSVYAGKSGVLPVSLTNSQPLSWMTIGFEASQANMAIRVDSVVLGTRTSYFESLSFSLYDDANGRFAVDILADNGGGSPNLSAGSGEVLRIHYTIDRAAIGGRTAVVDTMTTQFIRTRLQSAAFGYEPSPIAGSISSRFVKRGDWNLDNFIDLADLSYAVSWLGTGTPPPLSLQCGDWDADGLIDLFDLSSVVAYLGGDGPPPANP